MPAKPGLSDVVRPSISDHLRICFCVLFICANAYLPTLSLMWSDHQSHVTIGDHSDGGDGHKIIFNCQILVHMKYF